MRKLPNRKAKFNRGPNAFILLLALLGLSIAYMFWYNSIAKDREQITFSTFLSQVESGNVKAVQISDQSVFGEFKKSVPMATRDNQLKQVGYFSTTVVSPDNLWQKMHDNGVIMEVEQQDKQPWVPYALFFLVFPFLLAVLYYFFKQSQGGASGSKIFNIGKSKARFFSPNTIKIKFKDVAGVEEAKEDLQDVVDFLKNPEKFKRIGAKIPRGVLLTGAPGNGKTLLAKAVAGEASCPFFSISGSDFVEVFVGVGASRVRDLFLQARRHTPCIVFIDEIDAVGRHRGAGFGGGNDEREQTLNQLLAEMDGFGTEPGEVIVLAATNRPDVLDKALLRPGRFDRKVEVPYPDLASREKILNIHIKGVKVGEDVDLQKIARGTPRFSGADLANLINEAALLASKRDREVVIMDDFEIARDKILVGAERKTLSRSKEAIEMTAYHESGHTLVVLLAPNTPPFHKVTILSRGGALGMTWYLPDGDEISKSEDEILSEIKVCLGGRLAEEIIYGKARRTTGAVSDLKRSTKLAYDMVVHYGMSELGPISLSSREGMKEYSSDTERKVDEQVRKIIDKCYDETKQLLLDNKDKLDSLAQALVERETLDAVEVYELLGLENPSKSYSFQGDEEESEEDQDKEHDIDSNVDGLEE
ncbi:ATP-dependent zinc metalloprotease FtsH [Candidatus Babeliales bacterium]|nr:ATP-dependent zinc metalloprotease FtsH [Candidatus Babeliales bacterium]